MSDNWNPEVDVSPLEEKILKLCKKQKLWGFLRRYRHRILDAEVRSALREMYGSNNRGNPVAPEQLALALVLQVAFHVPDHEVPTLTAVDHRWKMVLDCLENDVGQQAFSQGTVFHFRQRAREHGLMTFLLEKTVCLARETKGFSDKRLRMMIDSSPLLGAGRVEDTFGLLGRAVGKLVSVAAAEAGRSADALAAELELTVVSGSSVKAALDVDWRLPSARNQALKALLEQIATLDRWLKKQFTSEALSSPPLNEAVDLVERLVAQDTEPDPDSPGDRRIRQGPAPDRQISISDPTMRHGRKSKTKVFSGYKRHIATDADIPGLVIGVHVLTANSREYDAAEPLLNAVESPGRAVTELHHDRGYLASAAIHERRKKGMRIISKPPTPSRIGNRLSKADFKIDMTAREVTCPGERTERIRSHAHRDKAYFYEKHCGECELKPRCQNKAGQRVVTLHPHEALFQEMSASLATAEGRAERRERIAVEHTLARLGSVQGTKARYRGLEKNQFHTESCALVVNLHVLNRIYQQAA